MKNSTLIVAAVFGGILGLMAPFANTPPQQSLIVVEAPLANANVIYQ